MLCSNLINVAQSFGELDHVALSLTNTAPSVICSGCKPLHMALLVNILVSMSVHCTRMLNFALNSSN